VFLSLQSQLIFVSYVKYWFPPKRKMRHIVWTRSVLWRLWDSRNFLVPIALCSMLLRLIIISWRTFQEVYQEHQICVWLIEYLQEKEVISLWDKNRHQREHLWYVQSGSYSDYRLPARSLVLQCDCFCEGFLYTRNGIDTFIGKIELCGCKIWGFHGGDCEGCCLLGCDAVWLL
jgi:hypothetical protein